MIATARAAALFVSTLSTNDHPSPAEIDAAIRDAIRTRGGSRKIAGDVAAAYGDYPELAVARMRWARGLVEGLRCRDTLAVAA
jgi:hypothetical protein